MKYYIINHSDNEMEGYQSSPNRWDDKSIFYDEYGDDAKSFSKMFILLFCFLF